MRLVFEDDIQTCVSVVLSQPRPQQLSLRLRAVSLHHAVERLVPGHDELLVLARRQVLGSHLVEVVEHEALGEPSLNLGKFGGVVIQPVLTS